MLSVIYKQLIMLLISGRLLIRKTKGQKRQFI